MANEIRSISEILKQSKQSRFGGGSRGRGRGSSRGGGKAGPGGPNDNLTPAVPPPLYPPILHKPSPLNPEVDEDVNMYKEMSYFLSSNFGSANESKNRSGFLQPRYTDQYKSPLTVNPHLIHKNSASQFSEELTKQSLSRPKPKQGTKRKIEDLPDNDDTEREQREGSPVAAEAASAADTPKEDDEDEAEKEDKNRSMEDDMDDIEEDLDEEMDMGTDYALSYFDNGEGDDDEENDDGGTY